ncbi:type I-C CRISPR-associated protein Cas8c/Csd1 [Neobacillus sp. SCS-31]|uniref:type I-C CRISPR-associated protein Cas8c/Csd1 n=1 Tax=Neobacillus oceani TaxID=3115292 RepID=UPI0039062821
MSWLLNLYKTYESNLDRVGEPEKRYGDREFTLLPISHTTQNAHIEVRITEDGNFHSAEVIDKTEANTLIPCSEKAASRAGKVNAPYPLHDKLVYVAGDLTAYHEKLNNEEQFAEYIRQLSEWADSSNGNNKVKAIFGYLDKRSLIGDLIKEKILLTDATGKLIEAWDKKYEPLYGGKPPLFSVIAGEVESAFVRFDVYSPKKMLVKVWKDSEMYNSFSNYYSESLEGEDLCFITGKMLPGTERHTNKIRNAADKAKLISANDSSGFTYRGRFNKSSEVAGISYDVSQKAHNALKWLINRQGKVVDQRVFLVWGNEDPELPDPTEDTFDILSMFSEERQPQKIESYTHQEFAREIAKALDGYRGKLVSNSNVNIMILDSATTGRLAVLYYRNMDKEHYLDKLADWHIKGAWLHRYRKDTNDKASCFFGSPSLKDIAFAAYGPRAGDKIVKGLMERVLPCIIDGRKVPDDIVRSAFNRAGNPVSMERWEWEKTLSIACSLINKREEMDVALDKENTDRNYLFGRLLAIADVLERNALGSNESRATNAVRYMNSFSKNPERTWATIQASLQPYQARLGTKVRYYNSLIDEVASKFNSEDFNNKPLTGKYLLGFYSQRHDLYQKKEKNEPVVALETREE